MYKEFIKMYCSVIFSLLCVALSSAHVLPGKPQLDGRIVGGQVVDIEKFPFQVSLQSGSFHFCGGSIISKRWILTAAHCTVGNRPSDITISIGSATTKGKKVNVEQIIVHEKYASLDFDYSLLKLAEDLEFDATVSSVELIGQGVDFADGDMCTVTGWGNTKNPAEDSSLLRGVEVPKTNQEYCNKAYIAYGGVSAQMICAGYVEGGKDACQGDSGGPLVDSYGVLVGVVSWGYGCAEPSYPGVYSRVSEARDWIRENSGV